MTKMSNLPRNLTEEVLSKLPLTSLRRVRSTCKKWNNLSKSRSFAKKHLAGQVKVAETQRGFMVLMLMDFMVYLLSVNLDNNVESCIKRQGKLCSLDDEVDDVNQIFYCDGLLLCITEDSTRLIVWNPYRGQIQRIKLTLNFSKRDMYSSALGFDKRSKSYSYILMLFIDEEKKVAVIFNKGKYIRCLTPSPNNIAYIFGVDGSLKEVL